MNHANSTDQKRGAVLLHTASGSHPLQLKLANSFLNRFRGLMLSAQLSANQGLLITRCSSVHTAFMLYPIDVVYVDSAGLVLKCVAHLKPWRGSLGNVGADAQGRATHTLELAAGTILRLAICVGDRLEHPLWASSDRNSDLAPGNCSGHQRGSAMIEFTVVGPIITLLGLAMLQYGMLFFAKNQINHASFMAARAGSTGHANLDTVRSAYAQALVPLYGGGQTADQLATALAKATADVSANTRIELISPTKESFDDWNDPALQAALSTGSKRVISNSNQAFKNQTIGPTSGQTIQDANLIKLRITQGYQPKVPMIASIYKTYLTWLDPKTDAFHSQLIDAGRIPVVTSITLHMQSDAIEGNPISMPGMGNGGNPVNPGDPPVVTTPPPHCATIGCTVENPPVDPGSPCTGPDCPSCDKI